MKRGLFVVFEGPDGCGKTTQVERLSHHLSDVGMPHITTRLPGGSRMGSTIRRLALGVNTPKSQGIDDLSRFLLIVADMRRTVLEVIKPELERGHVVLCDRYTLSSFAYQVYGRGLRIQDVMVLVRMATEELQPDLQLIFDADYKTLDARSKSRGLANDAFEGMARSSVLKMREFYRGYFEKNICHINVNHKSIDEVEQMVACAVLPMVYDTHSRNLCEDNDV